MQNAKLLIATLVITVGLVFGMGWLLSKMFATTPAPNTSNITIEQSRLLEGAEHSKGATESARFTIVEFSDFECPACAATAPSLSALVAQYPDQVRVVYRHFPLLAIHPNSRLAGEMAEAASEQGMFWEMHDKLFETQMEWSGRGPEENLEYFLDMAAELGMNREQMAQAVQSEAVQQEVETDLRMAEQMQLSFTPSLFLNGQLMDIAQIQQEILQAQTE